jgi:hypothetical protein
MPKPPSPTTIDTNPLAFCSPAEHRDGKAQLISPIAKAIHIDGTAQIGKSISDSKQPNQQFQIQNRNKRYIILKAKLTRICKHRSITEHEFD